MTDSALEAEVLTTGPGDAPDNARAAKIQRPQDVRASIGEEFERWAQIAIELRPQGRHQQADDAARVACGYLRRMTESASVPLIT
jgi:hypothetical protein